MHANCMVSFKKRTQTDVSLYPCNQRLKVLRSYLFWMRAITCEYVFPRTLSPFTFTSRSPAKQTSYLDPAFSSRSTYTHFQGGGKKFPYKVLFQWSLHSCSNGHSVFNINNCGDRQDGKVPPPQPKGDLLSFIRLKLKKKKKSELCSNENICHNNRNVSSAGMWLSGCDRLWSLHTHVLVWCVWGGGEEHFNNVFRTRMMISVDILVFRYYPEVEKHHLGREKKS